MRIADKADRTAAAAAAADAIAALPEGAAAVFEPAATVVAQVEGPDMDMDDDLPDYEEPEILA